MLEHISPHNVLFLDIETVPCYASYDEVPEPFQKLWDNKTHYQRKDEYSAEEFYSMRAGVMAEFAKIICISVGFISEKEGSRVFRIKSFFGDDEQVLLETFAELLRKHYQQDQHLLCAHNGKEFDFPFIARRMLVNRIKLPKILDIAGKKPWEVRHLDTMELWKFGDWKNYTSISLLAALFNIPTPKDDIDGSQVGHVYWEEKDLSRIVTYCQKDTLTVAQLFLSYRGEALIDPEHVLIADD